MYPLLACNSCLVYTHPSLPLPTPSRHVCFGLYFAIPNVTCSQARVSFKRIEAFLSRSGDDVRNEEVYGKAGSDRHCPDLAKGQLRIENGKKLEEI